jgi:CubicO group peptidase (beta-lactamase class C family)
LFLCLVWCAVGAPALVGAAPPLTKETIAAAAQPLVDQKQAVGLVVGVIGPGGRAAYGFGQTKAGGPRPDGQTVFEIGSITKVFTAILLAQAAARGDVRLDQPLHDLLPEGSQVPRGKDRQITLEDLATHTSGLPRLPPWEHFRSVTNPYAAFDGPRLLAALGDCELESEPGEDHEYSNLGAALLGYALAAKAGLSYEDLVMRDVCGPLRLADTRVKLSDQQSARLAAGHTALGLPAANWDFDAFAGAGGLRSTADDLLVFAAANLELPPTPLGKSLAECLRPRRNLGEDGRAMGLAWHFERLPESTERYVGHNGGTGGYSSFLGLVPKKKIGVVVLGNTGRGEGPSPIDELGIQLLRQAAKPGK